MDAGEPTKPPGPRRWIGILAGGILLATIAAPWDWVPGPSSNWPRTGEIRWAAQVVISPASAAQDAQAIGLTAIWLCGAAAAICAVLLAGRARAAAYALLGLVGTGNAVLLAETLQDWGREAAEITPVPPDQLHPAWAIAMLCLLAVQGLWVRIDARRRLGPLARRARAISAGALVLAAGWTAWRTGAWAFGSVWDEMLKDTIEPFDDYYRLAAVLGQVVPAGALLAGLGGLAAALGRFDRSAGVLFWTAVAGFAIGRIAYNALWIRLAFPILPDWWPTLLLNASGQFVLLAGTILGLLAIEGAAGLLSARALPDAQTRPGRGA
jgi:hypothetical protein